MQQRGNAIQRMREKDVKLLVELPETLKRKPGPLARAQRCPKIVGGVKLDESG